MVGGESHLTLSATNTCSHSGLKGCIVTNWREELNRKRRADGWYGCDAPDGWRKLIEETDELLAYMDPEYKIQQVKEKFGELRYYYESSEDATEITRHIMDIIASNSERQSRSICQRCGSSRYDDDVKLRGKAWVATLCVRCASGQQIEV